MLNAAIVAARFFQFASAMVLFGSSAFFLYGSLAVFGTRKWPHRLLLAASVIAVASGVAWLCLDAVALSGDAASAADTAFLWSIASETEFGRIFLFRSAVSLVSLGTLVLCPCWHPRLLWSVQGILGAAIVASYAWSGHGVIDEGAAGMVHAGADVVHLLAAGIWIGALIPLGILLLRPARTDAREADHALMRFSGIGAAIVALLVLSGLVNSWFLVGPSHVLEILSSAYGVVLVAKLCMFAAMLGLAAANRYRLAPRLKRELERRAATANALAALRLSVTVEIGLGLLVLLAVAALGTLPPPISGG